MFKNYFRIKFHLFTILFIFTFETNQFSDIKNERVKINSLIVFILLLGFVYANVTLLRFVTIKEIKPVSNNQIAPGVGTVATPCESDEP